jgi:hypothetical protein
LDLEEEEEEEGRVLEPSQNLIGSPWLSSNAKSPYKQVIK